VTVSYDSTNRRLVWSWLTFRNNNAFDLSFKAIYRDTVARTNFAEICKYNGKSIKDWNINEMYDADSDPCNRGANPPVEDDESSATINPRTGWCVGWCSTRNYCGDGLVARPNSYGQYEECDKWAENGKPWSSCSITCKSTWSPVCGDGIVQYWEVCDQWKNGGRIPTGRPYAWRLCTSSCSIEWVANPACDYIDPPSIQANEYLPYRWDLEDVENLKTSCEGAGDIIRNSLTCEFTVKDAKWAPIDRYSQPCGDPVPDKLTRSAYVQVMRSLWYDPDDQRIKPYGFDSRKFAFTSLGEHKITVELKSYNRCVAWTNGALTQERVTQMTKPRVCEMNFAVTTPYMVSRWPLGNFTSEKDGLTRFLYMPKWLQVFTSPIPAITQKFDVTNEVIDSVNKLVEEYKKVAVVVDGLPTQFGKASKVPWKDIYLFESATDEWKITITDDVHSSLWNKAFTIIVTRWHLVVKGNLEKAKNGMYINASRKWSISFNMDDARAWVKWCDVTQVVNGIFISLNTLDSRDQEWNPRIIANTNQNEERCMWWDLTVRWVMIGNWLTENVVNRRRSNVNDWFTQLTAINADRKEYLLNHGAVVLKYNPDLFDNLPPGWEILSQVLNTYKR
jgi:hypothetical protein